MYSAPKVRRNVFKTEEKKGTEEKALLTMEFPDLLNEKTKETQSQDQKELPFSLSYMNMASKEKEIEESKDSLEEGYCRLSWDNQRRLVIEGNPFPKKESIQKETYHEYVSKRMSRLFEKWEEYRRVYIEMYGEDAYHVTTVEEYATEDDEEECTMNYVDNEDDL